MLAQDLELGVDAIADVLRSSEFANRLQAVYAIQREQIPYRDLAAVYVDEVETVDAYPSCEIVAANSDYTDLNSSTLRHELSLQFTVNGDNPQRMAREVKRLIVASRGLFNGSLLPFVGGNFRAGRADYGPTSPGRDQPFVKSAALQVFWETISL
ncbi:MAG TPA: hypothetical protein VIK76_02295 [Pyrinomonadaceae bacterium]|jgi:hypothetical protein